MSENEDYLMHYGTKRHSGRYPWGSGDNPYQREDWFVGFDYGDSEYNREPWFCDEVAKLREQGHSPKEIAKILTPRNSYKTTVAERDDPEKGVHKGDRILKLDKDGNPIPKEMSVDELRARNSVSLKAKKQNEINTAVKLKEKGMSTTAIAEKMFGEKSKESYVRTLLAPHAMEKAQAVDNTTKMLKAAVDQKQFVDVGRSAELLAGVTRTRLKTAIAALKDQGYELHYINARQIAMPGQKTGIMVLCPPGTTYTEANKAVNEENKLQTLGEYHSIDNGKTWLGIRTPESVSSDRIYIRDKDHGGLERDGMIELRPGVQDLSLEKSMYAQVRIAVDGTHYIKGMAVYNAKAFKDLPEGIDIIVNSKHESTGKYANKLEHLKLMKGLEQDPETGKITGKVDKDNPFGASVKLSEEQGEADAKLLAGGQHEYLDIHTGEKKLSAINKVNEEGDWEKWRKTLASEFLAKQPNPLVKRQLDEAYKLKEDQFERINQLTNPAVKKRLLEPFAEKCDTDAVSLRAAALPRQATCVIIPSVTLKDNEIYAPKFNDGEEVVLVRYPHGGKFELPSLIVNNSNKECKSIIGSNPRDAVMINKHVANQLSGADFDGDTVLVLPNNKKEIKVQDPNHPALAGLRDFDTGVYANPEGTPKPKHQTCQIEMGKITNLITDMQQQGASLSEQARAVKHSMVVIDAEKHNLNMRQSYIENGIDALKQKYQQGGGAGTIISRAKSPEMVSTRRLARQSEGGPINPETGEKNYIETEEYYHKPLTKTVKGQKVHVTDENGKEVWIEERRLIKSTKMAEAKDARELLSGPDHVGTEVERTYADYANKLKALANKARKASLAVEDQPYSEAAALKYKPEVESLKKQLKTALLNKPAERKAQALAGIILKQKMKDDPSIAEDKEKKKKYANQAVSGARSMVGARKQTIDISEREWEAIQKGAIRKSVLKDILDNTDLDVVTKYATPIDEISITPARQARIRSLLAAGHTQSEVAELMGVSTSTVNKYK
ncbi:MAG: helix-turn-helix domain-containing protein [Bacilli bacterium]|nr:helix-turn-helix domain-containing protein [Bacilli bacterium]